MTKYMECKKEYIPTKCLNPECTFYKNCALLQTEVVKTRDDEQIDIMFIGQGAGEKEHLTHHPFTGPAGKVLREKLLPHLKARNLNITLDNTIRCRPLDERGKNRAPTQDEVKLCIPILWDRIDTLRPSVIVTLGASASGDVIPSLYKKPISSVRGKTFAYKGYPFIPTVHPAAILHTREEEVSQRYHEWLERDIVYAISLVENKMRLI